MSRRHSHVLPGFSLTLGLTLSYLSLVVLFPFAVLLAKTAASGVDTMIDTLRSPRVIHALLVSFRTSFFAALINAVFGLLIAWVMVRYRFPGKRIADAMIDLPFALPTAVAGIALTALYAPQGWVGRWFAPYDISIAYTPLGIAIALTFIGLPYVVRTLEPVLQDMEAEVEEAAITLGASRLECFVFILLPPLVPPLLTGFALAFARGLGEYGSVIFIAGNMPMVSEIVPLLIVTKLEQYDYQGAMILASAMLCLSFIVLLVINVLQKWSQRQGGKL